MCEKRARKIKKGSAITRLRETRRVQRIQRMTPSPTVDEPTPGQLPQHITIDKAAQNKVILELAWKTVALMHKNKLIQQKIIALQKETSDFVASIINNPDNRQRYIDYVKAQAKYSFPIAQDYVSSPQSPGTYSSGTFSQYSPSSPELSSAPMSPEWETDAQTLDEENIIRFKTEPEF